MLTIITREFWKAKPPPFVSYSKAPATTVFWVFSYSLLCTTLTKCASALRTYQNIEAFYNKREDIPYNFMIGGDGRVYEGRGWDVRPHLPKKFADWAADSLYFAYITKPLEPSEEVKATMENTMAELIRYGVHHNFINSNYEIDEIIKEKERAKYNF